MKSQLLKRNPQLFRVLLKCQSNRVLAKVSTANMQLATRNHHTASRIAPSTFLRPRYHRLISPRLYSSTTTSSSESPSSNSPAAQPLQNAQTEASKQELQKKTMAQIDEELRQKLEGMSGEGGAAGIELENGKPVAMKRGVRENMFRLI
jgi:hypothetical protein